MATQDTVAFTMRLEAAEAAALDVLARGMMTSRTELVRQAIRAYLEDMARKRAELPELLDQLMESERETLDLLSQ